MILFYITCFFGGVFLANGVPHFVKGVTGEMFPTPFAKPPGRGNSSPIVNVIWGLANFAVAWLLLCRVVIANLHELDHVAVTFLGALVISLFLAWHFGQIRNSRS